MWNPFRPTPVLTRLEVEEMLERHAATIEERHRELLDGISKQSRLLARLALRHEDMEKKIEGGFGELRSARASAGPDDASESLEEVFASIDALGGLARSGEGALGDGLRMTVRRLERYLEARGVVAIGADGETIDARAYEVVGTVERPGAADGTIVERPRIAYRKGDRIVRMGTAVVARTEAQWQSTE
jgi:molecular chaperone GrpE (heat shock protein)